MRAVLYLRISDEKQKENTSLETQEAVCRSYCASQKFHVVDVVKNEAVSAKFTNTQRLVELLDYCKQHKGQFDVLVVFNLSRFARSQEHHHFLRSKLKAMNILLRSASERIDESPTGKLIEGVLASVNEYDNAIRIEKTKLSMIQRLNEGLWPWNPPPGYYLPQVPGVRLSVAQKDPACWRAMREIFELYATGRYPFSTIARKINKKHLIPHRCTKVKYFIHQDIEKIINNPFYCGILKSSIDDGTEHEGKHEPVISKQLWHECQKVKNSRGSKGAKIIRKRISEDFYLRGLLRSVKEHRYTGAFSKGRRGDRFGYYFCQHRDCGNHAAPTVHDQLLNYLDIIQPAQEDIDLYFEIFSERMARSFKQQAEEEKRLMFVTDTLKKKKNTLIEMRSNHELNAAEFIEAKSKLTTELVDIESQISSFKETQAEWQEVLAYGKSYITDMRGRCESLTDVSQKVSYLGSIFPTGLVYDGKFLSNQQTLEIISHCNAQKRQNVTPQGIEPWFTG